MKISKKSIRVLAIIGIVLLVSLYVVSLILAFIKNDFAKRMLMVSLTGTFVIPVIIYIISMFYKLSHKNDVSSEDDNSDK